MNRDQINAFRTSQGLAPIVDTPAQVAAKKRRKAAANANAAAHAALQREIRNMRNRNRKG